MADSLVLRQLCRVYTERVPNDTTLIRWANLIQPATLYDLLDHVLDLARQLKVTRARKLRIDGTVVETTIHSRHLQLEGFVPKTRLVQFQVLSFDPSLRSRAWF